ncbi:MAG: plasmid pRiA4b ORF-3 family protein [Dysgonamonadaceae bacterium]|jgi:hypothetical protein|nr:plasmid pRiA4b ORF-3 family protein [Dysgonamonadaceae bacterium]
MVYRFVILSDEADNFRRDILIDSDATFYDLHEAILNSVGYKKDEMTSFFICDENWEKEKEITLIEMDISSEKDSYIMDSTRLSDLLDEERQKILYVFDFLTDRAFFMELKEIITGKSQPKAECVKLVGRPPVQTINFEEFETKMQTFGAENDDFYGNDDLLNLDGYDEEDLENLSDGNPFEEY